MLTPQAIEDFKGFLDNNIAYAKVTVNGEGSEENPDSQAGTPERRAGGGLPEHYAAGGDGSDNSTGTALQQK